ncbi:MAG: DsbA family protein [Candidatus Bipolaricaulia bacterium]
MQGAPTFFINGRLVVGAQPYEKFKQIIEEELGRSGR